MKFLGLWPPKVNDFLYVFFNSYMIIYYIMAARHLIRQFGYLDRIIGNLTDNILLIMIWGKMFVCRRSCGAMASFLKAIENDFSIKTYGSVQEKMAYLYYNEFALMFTKISVIATAFTAILYYFRSFIANWDQCKYMIYCICTQLGSLIHIYYILTITYILIYLFIYYNYQSYIYVKLKCIRVPFSSFFFFFLSMYSLNSSF